MIRRASSHHLALLMGLASVATLLAAPASAQTAASASLPTVKLSPRARAEPAPNELSALLAQAGVEAFVTEAEVLSADALNQLPRIVATPDNRLLLGQGDRAFARSGQGTGGPFLTAGQGTGEFRVVRNSRALRDPTTGDELGQELQVVGKATLLASEALETAADGKTVVVPATLRITSAKEEIRTGDRLLPVTAPNFEPLVGKVPTQALQGQVLGIYGSGVNFAGQNQVILINRGRVHGLEQGHLLTVLKDGRTAMDRTNGNNTPMQLPADTNGRIMVFRAFDKVSYALILNNNDAVKVGDRIAVR